MDNFVQEKKFNYNEEDSIKLIYCGIRERCYGHKYGKHMRDSCILTLINEGNAKFNINGEEVVLSQNHFYVMYSKSGMSYVTQDNVPWSISWIVAEGRLLEGILSDIGITRDIPYLYVRNHENLKNIYNKIFAQINYENISSRMECISLLYNIFGILAKEKEQTVTNVFINNALNYIHEHYCEELNVYKLSSLVGLNHNYFSKLFKSQTGVNPCTYLIRLKLDKAKFLLRNTDMKVDEIAQAIGYTDPFYFSRLFRKNEEMSPSDYRNRC